MNFDIPDSCLSFSVPGFILNPLVENAIKFGMETSEMPLRVNIEARLMPGGLKLSVSNTGRWMPEGNTRAGAGTGLSNIKSRLAQMYPGLHRFDIEKGQDQVRVIMEISLDHNGKD